MSTCKVDNVYLAATKRPGRPSTRPRAPVVEKLGVQYSPKDPKCSLELVYDNPLVLKNLFTYFRNVKTKVIFIKCEPTKMLFILEQCHVYASLDVAKVNRYYCEKPVTLSILRENLDSVFNAIKSFYKISIKKYSNSELDKIIFTIYDSEVDKECSYKVMLCYHELQDIELEWAKQEQSLISFTLSSKQLRKSINDIASAGDIDEASLVYVRGKPLMLKYSKPGIDYSESYNSNDRICLKCSLPPDQIVFKYDFNVRKITALANSIIAKCVTIACQQKFDYSLSCGSVMQEKEYKMVFASNLDTNLVVYTHVSPPV